MSTGNDAMNEENTYTNDPNESIQDIKPEFKPKVTETIPEIPVSDKGPEKLDFDNLVVKKV